MSIKNDLIEREIQPKMVFFLQSKSNTFYKVILHNKYRPKRAVSHTNDENLDEKNGAVCSKILVA